MQKILASHHSAALLYIARTKTWHGVEKSVLLLHQVCMLFCFLTMTDAFIDVHHSTFFLPHCPVKLLYRGHAVFISVYCCLSVVSSKARSPGHPHPFCTVGNSPGQHTSSIEFNPVFCSLCANYSVLVQVN